MKRLAIQALPGDVGGPVLDTTGAVVGLLLPPGPDQARILPEGVHFAAAAAELARVMAAAGLPAATALPQSALPPADLAAQALGMTALVSCWD